MCYGKDSLMSWLEVKARLLQLGMILCPTGKEQRGLLEVVNGAYTEATIYHERESDAVKSATSQVLLYLSECVNGQKEWFTK